MTKRAILVFYLLTILSFLFGQNHSPDYYLVDGLDYKSLSQGDQELIESSLKAFYDCDDAPCKVEAITQIVEESWDINVWPAYNEWLIDFLEKQLPVTIDQATKRELTRAYASATSNVGYLHNLNGKILEALDAFERTKKIQQSINDYEGLANTFINLASVYMYQGMIEKSLDSYYEALEITEQLNDQQGQSTTLNGIGYIYYQQGDNEKALEKYQESMLIRREIGDQYGIATCLNNIGLVHRDLGDLDLAIDHFRRSMEIEEQISDLNGVAISLGNIAHTYKLQKDYRNAEANYLKSLRIFETQEDLNNLSQSYRYLSEIALLQGQYEKAISHGKKALDIGEALGFPARIRDAAETLSKVYRATKQWPLAMEYRDLYDKSRDSIFNENTIATTAKLEYKYHYEKKAMADSIDHAYENAMNKLEIRQQKEEIRNNRIQISALILISILVLLLLAIVFRSSQQNKKAYAIIATQKETVEKSRDEVRAKNIELRQLNQQLENTVSELRKTQKELVNQEKLAALGTLTAGIAHEINNPINYISTATKVLIDFIEKNTKQDESIAYASEAIADGIKRVTNIVSSLNNYSHSKQTDFVDYNIIQCIEDSLNILLYQNRTEIRFIKSYPENLMCQCIPGKISQMMVNLINNAIQSIEKQGSIEIKAQQKNGSVGISVIDSGSGIDEEILGNIFDPFFTTKNVGDGSGLGLFIVSKILDEHHGEIKVESEFKKGTTVAISIPINQPSDRI